MGQSFSFLAQTWQVPWPHWKIVFFLFSRQMQHIKLSSILRIFVSRLRYFSTIDLSLPAMIGVPSKVQTQKRILYFILFYINYSDCMSMNSRQSVDTCVDITIKSASHVKNCQRGNNYSFQFLLGIWS